MEEGRCEAAAESPSLLHKHVRWWVQLHPHTLASIPPASALSSCIWCSAASRMRSDWSSTSNLGGKGAVREMKGARLDMQPVQEHAPGSSSQLQSSNQLPTARSAAVPYQPPNLSPPHLPCAAFTAS